MLKEKDALAVISDESQYKALIRNCADLKSVEILCDNPGIYNFLSAKGVEFTPIEDELIKDKWLDINLWACERAMFSGDELASEQIFNGLDLKSLFYPRLSNYLSAFLISFYMTEYIFKAYKPKKVIVYNNIERPDFPASNTNYFLNLLIKKNAAKKAVPLLCIDIRANRVIAKTNFLRNAIRFLAAIVHSHVPLRKTCKNGILVYGALSHFSEVILALKTSGRQVVVFDRAFQVKTYKFCKKNNVRYIVPPACLRFSANGSYKTQLTVFMDELVVKKRFVHGTMDFSEIIRNEILNSCEKYLNAINHNADFYFSAIKNFGIEKVIINEDITALNSHMAAFFRSKGVKVFCVSHGIPSPKPNLPEFTIKDLKKRFCLSETIVQSEYEKQLYIRCGWDKDHLHVLGLPRYDRLAKLKMKAHETVKKDDKMRILYCASGMFDDIRHLPLYPGEQYSTVSRHAKYCLDALLKSVEGIKARLIVKPHFISDVQAWTNYLAQCPRNPNLEIQLAQASSDFLSLLLESDVLATGYSSTAVVESDILGIPVVMIYYPDPSYLCPLSKKGLSIGVRNNTDLKTVLANIYASFLKGERYKFLPESREELEFLIGKNDGENVKRLVAYVSGE